MAESAARPSTKAAAKENLIVLDQTKNLPTIWINEDGVMIERLTTRTYVGGKWVGEEEQADVRTKP